MTPQNAAAHEGPKGGQTTRAEHLAWCKERALELCDAGKVQAAWTSMVSDLGKHPETAGHTAIKLGSQLFMDGHLDTARAMRRFIDGFR